MTSAQTLLVIEDEEDVQKLITLHLERSGFKVDAVADGGIGLERVKKNEYPLIILDWMLPTLSGMEFLKRFREINRNTPVLMVTARAESGDIIAGLETGADDYLTKPFEIPILLARVKALLRRRSQQLAATEKSAGSLGPLRVDEGTFKAFCHKEELTLTKYEFKLLAALVKAQGKVLTRDQLIAQIQGEGVAVVARAVDTHVFGLRKKLGACQDFVETIRGIGYRIRGDL